MKTKCILFYVQLMIGVCQMKGNLGEKPAFLTSSEDNIISLSEEGCGKRIVPKSRMGRIVNGKEVSFGEFPWQVAIISDLSLLSNEVTCGGSLLNNEWIITAAHCFDDYSSDEMIIRLGEYNILSEAEPFPYVERNLSQVVIHSKYNETTFEYDAALVKMNQSVEFQPHIQPICLPAKYENLVGKMVTATGWGKYFEDGQRSPVLQQVTLPVIRNRICEIMFHKSGHLERVRKIFVCAGYSHGKWDTCSGDSGGPLQLRVQGGRWVLVGVISWGYGCAQTFSPGLSVRVSLLIPWIQHEIS